VRSGKSHGDAILTVQLPCSSFVQDGQLYIVPTLTSDVLSQQQILNGYTLNLTADGTCTSDKAADCVVSSNSSLATVINPVRSARLTTKLSKGIKYGKIEVTAKMPKGDWIWPAIWMLPTNSVYGEWPKRWVCVDNSRWEM
jgi:beta-glucanase (GH16 family)